MNTEEHGLLVTCTSESYICSTALRLGFMVFSTSHTAVQTVESSRGTAFLKAGRLVGLVGGAIAMTLSLSGVATAQINDTETTEATKATEQSINQTPVVAAEVIAPPAAPSPAPNPFSPVLAGVIDLSAGTSSIMSVGQLRPRDVEALSDDDVDWLKSVVLPLYVTPDGDHWGWIYQGWLIPKGQTYLAIGRDAGFAMVKAYENLYTFPVLETREDGWFRVQYTPGGSAWAHSSQLELGDVPLAVEGWEAQLEAQGSVYFLEKGEAQALRSQPEDTTNMLSMVTAGSLIEPVAFDGDWMQVKVTRPASACRPLTGATVTEGWMRWRGEKRESLVWYRPEGCAQAG